MKNYAILVITIRIILLVIGFLIIIGISSKYFNFHWYLKKHIIHFKLSLISTIKQQFIRHTNGKYQRNKHKKRNLLFL